MLIITQESTNYKPQSLMITNLFDEFCQRKCPPGLLTTLQARGACL